MVGNRQKTGLKTYRLDVRYEPGEVTKKGLKRHTILLSI